MNVFVTYNLKLFSDRGVTAVLVRFWPKLSKQASQNRYLFSHFCGTFTHNFTKVLSWCRKRFCNVLVPMELRSLNLRSPELRSLELRSPATQSLPTTAEHPRLSPTSHQLRLEDWLQSPTCRTTSGGTTETSCRLPIVRGRTVIAYSRATGP